MTHHGLTPAILASAALLACSAFGPDGPGTVRGPAILVDYAETTAVTVPISARIGVPVVITVTSFGGGCVAQGETESTIRGLEADIRPYRYETVHLPPNMACTTEFRTFQHTVSLQFEESGDARVKIRGLRRPGDAPYVVERALTVLP